MPQDLSASQSQLASAMTADAAERAARVRIAVFDVDGVLTDGRLVFDASGETLKVFDVRDGHGIRLLQQAGIRCALLSGRRSDAVAARARELGIVHALQGIGDKRAALDGLLATVGLGESQCAFVGDDWPDLPVLGRVGFAASVADADQAVRGSVHWVSAASGGRGAVRQFAEFVLRSQGRYEAMLAAARAGTGSGHA